MSTAQGRPQHDWQPAAREGDVHLHDRPVDFHRPRHTRCAACGHEQVFDLDWFERWSQGHETCPGCGMACTEEHATHTVANPSDPALDGPRIAKLSWWHTSTFRDWPSLDCDPAGRLDALTIKRMGTASVARWAARQRAKALHVGTYESAIHNMLRRMRDQPESGAQFYLYRVQLRPDAVASSGYQPEVVDWMGDVPLAEVSPPGIDVTRYMNGHEDPGGISLALGRPAISAVQRLTVPRTPADRPDWWDGAVAKLRHAARLPVPNCPEPTSWRERLAPREHAAPVAAAQRDIAVDVVAPLPVNIRDQVASAACDFGAEDSGAWCDQLAGLVDLVDCPDLIIGSVRAEPVFQVVTTPGRRSR